MELQEQQARAIVHEINTVLPQKINLMNKEGIIIASTDPERVQSSTAVQPASYRTISTNSASTAMMNTPGRAPERISCCKSRASRSAS